MHAGFEPQFGQVADEFERFRPDYPQALLERILCEVPPERHGKAIDLGAGTGKMTRFLAAHFAEVIAVEPDARMSAKIREQFPRVAIKNSTAEKAVEAPASADLIAIATAFHWMDGPQVLANCAVWLRSAGVLAIFDLPFPSVPEPLRAVVKREMKERWAAFRDTRLSKAGRWQDVVHAAPEFHIIEEGKFPHVVPVNVGDFVGFCRSTSYGNAYARSLDDPVSYWRELESLFRANWSDGMIPVDFSPDFVIAKKE